MEETKWILSRWLRLDESENIAWHRIQLSSRVPILSVAFFISKVACPQKFNKTDKQETSWQTREIFNHLLTRDVSLIHGSWMRNQSARIFFNQVLGLHFYGDSRWPFIANTSSTDETKAESNQYPSNGSIDCSIRIYLSISLLRPVSLFQIISNDACVLPATNFITEIYSMLNKRKLVEKKCFSFIVL